MRVRQLHLLLLLSLTLGLFCGELNESFRLADDTSNDLVEISPGSPSKCAEAAPAILSKRHPIVVEKFICNLAVITSSGPRKLLRLLSIQRK
jgi:hypothetical protein